MRRHAEDEEMGLGLLMVRLPDDGKPSHPGTHGRYPVLMELLADLYYEMGSSIDWPNFEAKHMQTILEMERGIGLSFRRDGAEAALEAFTGGLQPILHELGCPDPEEVEQDALGAFVEALNEDGDG